MAAKYWKYILLIIGVLVLLTGIGFKLLNFPDALMGIYTGPLLIVISLILLLNRTKKQEFERERISSLISPFYIKVLPFIMAGVFLFSVTLTLKNNTFQLPFEEVMSSYFFVVSSFFFLMTLFCVFLSRVLWDVKIDDEYIYFSGLRKTIKRKRIEIKRVVPDLHGKLYRVEFKDKDFNFIPDFFESTDSMFSGTTPPSVKKLRDRI